MIPFPLRAQGSTTSKAVPKVRYFDLNSNIDFNSPSNQVKNLLTKEQISLPVDIQTSVNLLFLHPQQKYSILLVDLAPGKKTALGIQTFDRLRVAVKGRMISDIVYVPNGVMGPSFTNFGSTTARAIVFSQKLTTNTATSEDFPKKLVQIDFETFISSHPMNPEVQFELDPLLGTGSIGESLLRLRTALDPFVHQESDLWFFVEQGNVDFDCDGTRISASSGGLVGVVAGTKCALKNQASDGPPVVMLAVSFPPAVPKNPIIK